MYFTGERKAKIEATEFILKSQTVICSSCEAVFATLAIEQMPPVTGETRIETDLHRVLDNPEIRSSLIAMCPSCNYCWWLTSFVTGGLDPDLLPAADKVDYAKRFAHAVFTGRKKNAGAIERALLALNGYWCAKEAKQPVERWLDLAIQELGSALKDKEWEGNRGYYHYVMAEMLRLAARFDEALSYYSAVLPAIAGIPAELLEMQKQRAAARDAQTYLLPSHLVQAIFCKQYEYADEGDVTDEASSAA